MYRFRPPPKTWKIMPLRPSSMFWHVLSYVLGCPKPTVYQLPHRQKMLVRDMRKIVTAALAVGLLLPLAESTPSREGASVKSLKKCDLSPETRVKHETILQPAFLLGSPGGPREVSGRGPGLLRSYLGVEISIRNPSEANFLEVCFGNPRTSKRFLPEAVPSGSLRWHCLNLGSWPGHPTKVAGK